MVGERAVQALGSYPETPGVLQAIVERLRDDSDAQVRLAAVEGLEEIRTRAPYPTWSGVLKWTSWRMRPPMLWNESMESRAALLRLEKTPMGVRRDHYHGLGMKNGSRAAA